jgi:hypothetical protein
MCGETGSLQSFGDCVLVIAAGLPLALHAVGPIALTDSPRSD